MSGVRTERIKSFDGTELAIRRQGTGRPVIMLHGLFSSAEMNWIRFGHAARLLLGAVDDTSEADLTAIAMPTLVVCGEKDQDNGSPQKLVSALPNARFEEIPGTHMNSVTEPALGDAIARFLTA